MKTCKLCKKEKPLEEFGNFKVSKDKLRYECKECSNKLAKEYRTKYKDRHSESCRKSSRKNGYKYRTRRTNYARQKKYGLSPEDFEKLKEQQEYKCLICSVELKELSSRATHIDHDHKTGEIRGILCHSCNTAIGLFRELPRNLYRAYLYVQGR